MGCLLGCVVGTLEGCSVGERLGCVEGWIDGRTLGRTEGCIEGCIDGQPEKRESKQNRMDNMRIMMMTTTIVSDERMGTSSGLQQQAVTMTRSTASEKYEGEATKTITSAALLQMPGREAGIKD